MLTWGPQANCCFGNGGKRRESRASPGKVMQRVASLSQRQRNLHGSSRHATRAPEAAASRQQGYATCSKHARRKHLVKYCKMLPDLLARRQWTVLELNFDWKWAAAQSYPFAVLINNSSFDKPCYTLHSPAAAKQQTPACAAGHKINLFNYLPCTFEKVALRCGPFSIFKSNFQLKIWSALLPLRAQKQKGFWLKQRE